MKKTKTKLPEETEINEDLEVFEEWEKKEALKPADDEGVSEGFEGLSDLEPEPAPVQKGAHTAAVTTAPGDPKTAAVSFADELAELAPDIPVNLVAVIGKTTMSVSELIKYRVGQTIDLKRAPGETCDLVANGRLIARGELVEMDGKMGVRILKMVR